MHFTLTARPARFVMPVLMLFALAACEENEVVAPTDKQDTVPVATQIAAVQPISDRIEAVGTMRASDSVEITARVSNVVTRLNFDEGALVEKNQVLVELESSEAQANLAEAEAALVEIRTQYDRSRELIRSNAISRSQLDQQAAQVNAAEARVSAARAVLHDHTLRAPFAGRVGLRHVSIGSLVTPGTTITTLDRVREMNLDFSVPESFIATIEKGQPVAARSIAFPDTKFSGVVNSVDARIDSVTRTVTVRARLPNEDGKLRPGMFMTVLLEKNPRNALVIPELSIVPEGDRKFVFVVDEDVVVQRQVEIGERRPGVVEITDGLASGEEIVVEGTQSLRHGSEIRRVATAGMDGGD